jgi:colicin import membrane protein
MRGLVVAIVLVCGVARADDTLDAGLALVDEMKSDADGSQLDDHLTTLKSHTSDLAKLHKDHKKDKVVSAKLDAVDKAAKEALTLGAAAKKVVKNKKAFPAADKKLKAKLAAYATAATAANAALAKAQVAATEKAEKAEKAAAEKAEKAKPAPASAPEPTPTPAPTGGTGGAKVVSTTCKKIEFLADGAGIGKDRKVILRAVLLDARRKQSRTLAANNALVTKADDYELAFTVRDHKNDWKVVDESYEWKETNAKSGAALVTSRKSSRELVKNDMLEVAVPPSGETVAGKISATISWKGGATEENDHEDCSFEIAVDGK